MTAVWRLSSSDISDADELDQFPQWYSKWRSNGWQRNGYSSQRFWKKEQLCPDGLKNSSTMIIVMNQTKNLKYYIFQEFNCSAKSHFGCIFQSKYVPDKLLFNTGAEKRSILCMYIWTAQSLNSFEWNIFSLKEILSCSYHCQAATTFRGKKWNSA